MIETAMVGQGMQSGERWQSPPGAVAAAKALLPPEQERGHRPAVATVAVGLTPQQCRGRLAQSGQRSRAIVLAHVVDNDRLQKIALQRKRLVLDSPQVRGLRARLAGCVIAPPRRRKFQR